jgi:hypothetical protein
MLIVDGQIHLWEKGTPFPQHRQEPYSGAPTMVVPANISDVPGLVASGRLPIDIVLLQVSGPDDAGR